MRALVEETRSSTLWSVVDLEGHGAGLPDFKVEKKVVCKGSALNKHVNVAFPSNKHMTR